MNNYVKWLKDNHVTIFLFHGVVEKDDQPVRNANRKHIEAKYFEEVLLNLKKTGTPISMDELLHCLLEKKALPSKSFCISFDDGFENNYSLAAPILDKLNIPAIFYITTKFIDENTMSWIDQISYSICCTKKTEIMIPELGIKFKLSDTLEKIFFLNEIRNLVKNNKNINIEELTNYIFDALGVEKTVSLDTPLDKKMTWDQVKKLSQEKKFLIGGHSHTHPILSFLDSGSLEDEISTSLRFLKSKLGTEIPHYSYPEGAKNSYSEEVIDCLRKHGILCCPSAIMGSNSINSDLFNLRRVTVT